MSYTCAQRLWSPAVLAALAVAVGVGWWAEGGSEHSLPDTEQLEINQLAKPHPAPTHHPQPAYQSAHVPSAVRYLRSGGQGLQAALSFSVRARQDAPRGPLQGVAGRLSLAPAPLPVLAAHAARRVW